MHYALRFGDADCQRLYVGHSLVKGAISFGIAHGLIEQVNEVIEQRILVVNVEGQYSVKESRHVVQILFPHFLASVAVTNKEANIAQGLTRLAESWDIAAFDDPSQHQTQSRA